MSETPSEPPQVELRGAWIHSPTGVADWGWDKTVKTLSDNGFNALFANLSWTVTSDYPSQVSVPVKKNADGSIRDCLQECLDACQKYGVQLHVWVVVCNMGEHTPEKIRATYREAKRTQVDAEGKASDYLAPQLYENQKLLQDVLKELVTKYAVDGVHLDYIRYPFGKYDCSEQARTDFEASLGRSVENWPEEILPKGALRGEYRQWCRDNITAMLRGAREAVKAVNPKIQLSVAVYGHWPSAKESVAQDAEAWVDEGLVDFLCPMNYSGKPQEASSWLQQQQAIIQGRVPIYSGLANYMCEDIEALKKEIQDTRVLGADGFICFQYKGIFAEEWLALLGEELTHESAVAPVAYGQPRPDFQWNGGGKRPIPWLLFWEESDYKMLECRITFTDKMKLPMQGLHVWLLRDGKHCDAPFHYQWEERTLVLKFRPETGGYYRWRLTVPDDGVFFSPTKYID